jgi:hypothetical protein
MIKQGELEKSLDLLNDLERTYVRTVEVFNLLGDVLIRMGHLEDGIRYKSLFEILRGTFRIAGEERKQRKSPRGRHHIPESYDIEALLGEKGPCPSASYQPVGGPPERPAGPEGEAVRQEGPFPVTVAMADEFMRQGHFDRAAALFDTLAEKRPDDETLKLARERAHKKSREKRLLQLLQGWLRTIQEMKAELSERR